MTVALAARESTSFRFQEKMEDGYQSHLCESTVGESVGEIYCVGEMPKSIKMFFLYNRSNIRRKLSRFFGFTSFCRDSLPEFLQQRKISLGDSDQAAFSCISLYERLRRVLVVEPLDVLLEELLLVWRDER